MMKKRNDMYFEIVVHIMYKINGFNTWSKEKFNGVK